MLFIFKDERNLYHSIAATKTTQMVGADNAGLVAVSVALVMSRMRMVIIMLIVLIVMLVSVLT